MEKIDKVIRALEMHEGAGGREISCVGCPYEEYEEYCLTVLHTDALAVITALKAERDDLRKDIEVLNEALTGAHDEVHRLAKSLRIARLQRKQAWEKLTRITGEREVAWLSE